MPLSVTLCPCARGAGWLRTHPPCPVDQVIELGNDVLATAAGDIGFPLDDSRALLHLDRAGRNSTEPSLSSYFPAESASSPPRGCGSLSNEDPTPQCGIWGRCSGRARAQRAPGCSQIPPDFSREGGDRRSLCHLSQHQRCSLSPGQELLPVSVIGRRLVEQLSANGTRRAGPGDTKGPHRVTKAPRRARVCCTNPGGEETRSDPQSSGSGSGVPQPHHPSPTAPSPSAHRQPSTACAGSRRPAREERRAQPGCGPGAARGPRRAPSRSPRG